MILWVLPLTTWIGGALLAYLAGAPAYEGMLVVLLMFIITKIDKNPWPAIFAFGFITYMLIFKLIHYLITAQLGVA